MLVKKNVGEREFAIGHKAIIRFLEMRGAEIEKDDNETMVLTEENGAVVFLTVEVYTSTSPADIAELDPVPFDRRDFEATSFAWLFEHGYEGHDDGFSVDDLRADGVQIILLNLDESGHGNAVVKYEKGISSGRRSE